MLTPVFWITQDDTSLHIRIRAPHGDLSALDYDHGEYMFVFSCAPYFLRLHFKQMVEEYGSGNGKVEWKSEEGEFHVTVPKIHKKEHFTDLDMITELLNPTQQREPHGRALVEEMDSGDRENDEQEEDEEDAEGNEFLIDQEILQEPSQSEAEIKNYGYGFEWKKIGVIERLRGEIGNLVDIQNPEDVEIQNRVEKMTEVDFAAFDESRYLADTLEPEEDLLAIISAPFAMSLGLTDEDRVKLKDLGKPKPSGMSSEILFSLVDIVYAYCYDQRVNQWESSCESGWTCAKLSASLSWFVKYGSVREALISSIRRSLVYPLYRNFSLSTKIIDDVCQVFSAGRTALLHVLCDIHRIFIESGEFRYILNDLFITDYIFWIQSVPEDVLCGIQKELRRVEKEEIGWDLEMLETEARMQTATLDSDDEPDN